MQLSAAAAPAPLPRLGARPCCSWEPQSSLKWILFLTQKVLVSAVTAPNTATSVSPPCHPGCPALGWPPCAYQRLLILAAFPGISHPLPDFQKVLGLPQRLSKARREGDGGVGGHSSHCPQQPQPGCSFLGQRVLERPSPWLGHRVMEQLPLL